MPQPKLRKWSELDELRSWRDAFTLTSDLFKFDLEDLAQGNVADIGHYEVSLRAAYLTIAINEQLRKMKEIDLLIAKENEKLDALGSGVIAAPSSLLIGLDGRPLS